MNRKILIGLTAVILATTLTGCSQVHFGKDAVTIGEVKKAKKTTVAKKKTKPVKKQFLDKKQVKPKQKAKPDKRKDKEKATRIWDAAKTVKLKRKVNNWGKKSGQTYQFYDGKKSLKTKKGATYPKVLTTNRFILNKKTIEIGYSPIGKTEYDYNVLAIANDDFKSWHNTYLFCLKDKNPIILLDQSKNENPIMVKVVKDRTLNKAFSKLIK